MLEHLLRIPNSALWRGHIGGNLLLKKCLINQKSKINIVWTLSFQPNDSKTKEAQAKIAKREKVSCERVLTQVAWLPRLACSNCCQGRLHQGKFNNHIVLSSMNIVLQLSALRLSTPPPSPTRKGGLLPYVVYTGVCRCKGYGFWSLSLIMVYNFTRVVPNRAWSARSTFHLVFPVLNRARVVNPQRHSTPNHWSKEPFLCPSSPPLPRAPEGTE